MPIEIKELHIKINVNDQHQTNAPMDKEPGQKIDTIINMCTEQILEIQSRKKER